MAAKAHHTIPRLHLQHFAGCNPPGQVWTYDSLTGKKWSKIPLETGTETHFYSVERDDGTQDTRIEELLSGIESRAVPTYETLLDGKIPNLNTQPRVYFSEFIAMLYVRTSRMRKMKAEIQSRALQALTFAHATNERIFDRLIARVEAERGEKMDSATKEQVRRAMIDPSDYEIVIPKHMTLRALEAADHLAPIFYNMKWSLAHPRNGGFFITSDNPVVRTTDPSTRHPALGDGGFKNKTAEVSFPLSTDVMLLTSWDMDARELGSFDPEHVEGLNELRAIHADRFVYAHVEEDWIANISSRYKDAGPRINSVGFGPSRHATTKVGRK